jgi:hypothetical protein
LRQAGVQATGKHFPGLGRATGNTDVTAGVTDPTTRTDPFLAPFRAAAQAGIPFMMVSSATYPAIDPKHIAAFSSTVIGTVLRGDLAFTGVVMSDSMAGAVAVQSVPPAQRALRFFRAGGDLLLVGGASPVPAMVAAVRSAALADPTFARRVSQSALRVLTAKAAMGLVTGTASSAPGVLGDVDGNGATDRVVYHPSDGTWRVRGGATLRWGLRGDVPVLADYDGDGRADLAVFRPSTGQWWVRGHAAVHYGQAGDIPVPADYDGNGRTDLAVFRRSTGQWFVMGHAAVHYGQAGDVPVPADYDGNGRADRAVFRPATGQWFVMGHAAVHYGQTGDVPVPADYDGDGRAHIAVYRPANGSWYEQRFGPVPFGGAGDVPAVASPAALLLVTGL